MAQTKKNTIKATAPASWNPQIWRHFPVKHIPDYDDQEECMQVEKQLASFPPLTSPSETRQLSAQLQAAERGQAFILQGGSCAENFSDFSGASVLKTYQTLQQMSCILNFMTKRPVIKIGRMAGQMAKPRSSPTQTKGDVTLPSYLGDIINDQAFTAQARRPDPQRMHRGYFYSAAILNFLRTASVHGYAQLRKMHRFIKEGQHPEALRGNYERVAQDIEAIFTFLHARHINPQQDSWLQETSFYTSHEALLLPYEEALTHRERSTNQWFDNAAHLLWIGDRTRQPNGGHIAFAKGIHNPVGVKVGPSMTGDELDEIMHILNPTNRHGRLVLICRMGSDKIEKLLPPLMKRAKKTGIRASWISDPMHGNTLPTKDKIKTRPFDKIQDELEKFFTICTQQGVIAGGVHLEMTGEDVTECLGGAQKISEDDLPTCYKSSCDPRLNAQQSRELTFAIAEAYNTHRIQLGLPV